MNTINVSKGQTLNFTANEKPVSGVIIRTERTPGVFATVTVETMTPIPEGAHLIVHGAGACGLAHPERLGDRFVVNLSVMYSSIDMASFGT
jgi:hypothetical protein